MVASAKVERVSLLEAQELDGGIRRLVTQTRIVGLTDAGLAVLTTALGLVPAAGSALAGFPDLILRERNPKLVEEEPGVVDVDLVYEHHTAGGQAITAPVTGSMVVRASARVQQTKTNKDIFGDTISLSHTYPSSDKGRPGETFTQGGEVDYFRVMRSFVVEGVRVTNNAWLIANSIIGKINQTAWSGGEIHEWMCVGVEWSLIQLAGASSRYTFRFELQHNPDTWNPQVVFIDDRTGKPPTGLIQDVGFKTVRILAEADFESVIGGRIQGA